MPVKRNRFELTEPAPLFSEDVEEEHTDVEEEHTEKNISPQVISSKPQRQQVL